ncbi:probable WRKY transcription factor 26 [Cynara cardunculus var. scolymus]|uniref:probable WRKY transcription factor 26 n=1 Tax=Cynara cardunculus var. scolymus TaxID=59895 RepID=UPI000D62F070|nr:probable WRKY transcription factor 26 [Cynara cardunculus var. scolymus]
MAETGGALPPQRRVPPMTITLPPRSSADSFLNATEVSPGPLTFVSNFFSDHYADGDIQSFSQILAEIVPFPAVQTPTTTPVSRPENGPFLVAALKEEPQTTQISDADDSSWIESYSVSESCNPEPVIMGGSTFSVAKAVCDGYNWRKYGQKQVKASELPRNYYRCSQTNCPMTKKVGHFLDGQISEIIYNGHHNHEPPRTCKRANDGAAVDKPVDSYEQVDHLIANGVAGDDCDEKRRKTKVETEYGSWPSRITVSEPKIVVQTRSEVDILDDGFKWRKYGQKAVKGTTYPRSYYRCTNVGCKVRKHVERDLADPKSVVTTYEGRHKHDIPVVAKRSNRKEIDFKSEIPVVLHLEEDQITNLR